MADRIVPVILAGGSGTRLWPLSTPERPKQFQAVAGEVSLLRQTLRRAADAARFTAPVIVGNAAHRDLIAGELAEEDITPAAVILEPQGRNTAPAILLAALLAQARDLGELLLVMPSDHFIRAPDKLMAAVDTARAAADAGHIVTFGIVPSSPETSYGYIRRGAPLSPQEDGCFTVAQFVEKPDRPRAEAMLSAGGHDWNSGMFLMPIASLFEEIGRLKPAMLQSCGEALAKARSEGPFLMPEARAFATLENISIDYALMEKTDRAVVVPVDPGWSDVGSWTAVADIAAKDGQGNTALGNVLLHDAANAYVRSDSLPTAVIGLDDVIVVTTENGVVVAHKSRAQDIRRMAETLRR